MDLGAARTMRPFQSVHKYMTACSIKHPHHDPPTQTPWIPLTLALRLGCMTCAFTGLCFAGQTHYFTIHESEKGRGGRYPGPDNTGKFKTILLKTVFLTR